MRILYVEDNPADADIAARQLHKDAPHFRLEVTGNISQARARLERLEQDPLDLVLTDVRLPDGDGLSLLREIREAAMPLAVVVITGTGDEETAVAALKAGADDYVVKRKDYLERLPLTLESAFYHYRAGAKRRALPLRVLYAEHDPADADLTRRHFARHAAHIQVDLVSSGREVIEAVKKQNGAGRFDVLLLDYKMPDLDGLELLKELKLANQVTIPVVLVTGQGSEELALQALKLGASSYLVKNPGYLHQLPGELESAKHNYDLARREEALALSEERYKRATLAGNVGVWEWNLESGDVHIDPVLKSILGYEDREIRNHLDEWRRLFHPDDLDGVMELARRTRFAEIPRFGIEHRMLDKDGSVRWVITRGNAVRDIDGGNALRLVGTQTDITDRKQATAALRESEARNRAMLRAMPDLMFLLTTDGVYLDYHVKDPDDFYVPPEEFLGKSIRDVMPAHLVEYIERSVRQAGQSSEPVYIEFSLNKDGVDREYECRLVSCDENTVLCIARDITEHYRSEEALRSSEERFREMADNLGVVFFVREGFEEDPIGRISYISPAYERVWGRTRESLYRQSHSCFEGVHPDDRVKVEANARDSSGAGLIQEYRVVRPDGEVRWVHDRTIPILDDKGKVYRKVGFVDDITERKHSEELVRESEQRFRAIFNEAGTGISLLDLSSGGPVRTNRALQTMLGCSSDELARLEAFDELTCAEDRYRDAAEHLELRNGERDVLRQEKHFVLADGSHVWANVIFTLLRDTAGRPRYLIGMHEDITERKDAERALMQSEERFRQLAENIGAVFFISEVFSETSPGKMLYVSPAYESIWGRSCQSLYDDARSWLDAVHPNDRERVQNPLQQQTGQFDREFRIVRPDGEVRWVHDRVFPVFSEKGEVYRVAGIIDDITEAKLAEEALIESRARYRSVVDSQTELICRYLPDTTLTFVNDAYCRFFGKARQDLVGTPFLDLIPPAGREAARKHVESLIENPRVEVDEHEVLLPDGSIGWQRWWDYAIHDSDGRLKEFQAIGQDITERKKAEDAVAQRDQVLNSMFHSISSRVVVLDSEGVVTYLSRPWEIEDEDGADGIRLGANYLVARSGESSNEFVAPALAGILRVMAGEVPTFTMEYSRQSGGQERWFLKCVDPMPPEHGGVVITHTDITGRKEVEKSLEQALAELQQLKDRLHAENIYLQEAMMVAHDFGEMVGRSKALSRVLRQAEQVAPLDTTVLVTGETGTGKELLAHAIHNRSRRAGRTLVKVNCATLPAQLIESELFGHEKGAFTGAHTRRVGRFEIANGGTIFLDEIGELPLDLQAKLLRVLQEGEFERLGSSRTVKVDVRVIAATNRNLEEAVGKGIFRSDLYYRLSIFPIRVPALRERKEDIPMLVVHFVRQLAQKLGKQIESIPQETMDAMLNYAWPGNIRELRNVIERAAIITQGTQLRLLDSLESRPIAQSVAFATSATPATTSVVESERGETLEESQRHLIVETLEKTYWRVEGATGAAALLGVHPNTLRSRMKKLGIAKPKFKQQST